MSILKNKKMWDLAGMVLGLIILIAGIVFMSSPPDSYNTRTTDYASFGGDYYTYQYDATCVVASNTAVTANNLREIGEALAKYFGFLFVAVGALTTVSYGKKYFAGDINMPDKIIQEEHITEVASVIDDERSTYATD